MNAAIHDRKRQSPAYRRTCLFRANPAPGFYNRKCSRFQCGPLSSMSWEQIPFIHDTQRKLDFWQSFLVLFLFVLQFVVDHYLSCNLDTLYSGSRPQSCSHTEGKCHPRSIYCKPCIFDVLRSQDGASAFGFAGKTWQCMVRWSTDSFPIILPMCKNVFLPLDISFN